MNYSIALFRPNSTFVKEYELNKIWFSLLFLPITTLFVCTIVILKIFRKKDNIGIQHILLTSLCSLHILCSLSLQLLTILAGLVTLVKFTTSACEIWSAADLLVCNCTFLHIAVLRMTSLIRSKRTTCAILACLASPWLISIVQSLAQLVLAQAADDVYNCVVTDGHFNCLGALFSFILPVGVCCAFHAPFARKLVRRREEEEEEISQDVNEEDHGNQEQITVDAGSCVLLLRESGDQEEEERIHQIEPTPHLQSNFTLLMLLAAVLTWWPLIFAQIIQSISSVQLNMQHVLGLKTWAYCHTIVLPLIVLIIRP